MQKKKPPYSVQLLPLKIGPKPLAPRGSFPNHHFSEATHQKFNIDIIFKRNHLFQTIILGIQPLVIRGDLGSEHYPVWEVRLYNSMTVDHQLLEGTYKPQKMIKHRRSTIEGTKQKTISYLLLMQEILHRLGCVKPCKQWDKLHINWCRISSINSTSWNSGSLPDEYPYSYSSLANPYSSLTISYSSINRDLEISVIAITHHRGVVFFPAKPRNAPIIRTFCLTTDTGVI